MLRIVIQLTIFLIYHITLSRGTPKSSPNWEEQIATDGIKFSGRNAHASCVYKGEIWVTGGRTAEYVTWNLYDSFKVADVWHSEDGALWKQVTELTGDFFAQNTDVTQPGPIAPWYERYGHSLNAVDTDGDGLDDMMVLLGGYSSSPSNDMWVTEDGVHWIYCGLAPWSARAWHSTVTFQKKLWLMGGTPLNNEVWTLVNVTKVNRVAPLTRSTYSPYTFRLDWVRQPDAPWSPRVGMGLVSHWYFNATKNEVLRDSRERIVLVGGYGGWPAVGVNASRYDGFVTRPDSWETYDGQTWRELNWNNTFQGRAWMAVEVMRDRDPRVHYPPLNTTEPPKMYLFGGGYIGYLTNSKKRVTTMQGKADAYWSQDGINWVKINYEEGGGKTTVPFFSSQEWTQTIVDTNAKYIGRWGLTVHSFNPETRKKFPGDFFLIAGDYTGGGDFANSVYRSLPGMFCDVEGVICGNHGHCGDTHCYCDRYYSGPYCTISSAPTKGGGTKSAAAASPRLRQRSAAALSLASAALVLTALL